MKIVKAAATYFLLVFGAGFALGVVRQLFVGPRLGEMWAELLEMPLMAAVIVVAARWVMSRRAAPDARASRLAVGGLALAMLLAAEVLLIVGLRRMSIEEYVTTREPVSGAVYLGMLVVLAVMPALVGRQSASRRGLTCI